MNRSVVIVIVLLARVACGQYSLPMDTGLKRGPVIEGTRIRSMDSRLAKNLLWWMTFSKNSGTNYYDVSGNNNDGWSRIAEPYNSTTGGHVRLFTKTNNPIRFGDKNAFTMTNSVNVDNSFTFMAWVNFNQVSSNYQSLIHKGGAAYNKGEYRMFTMGDKLWTRCTDDSTGYYIGHTNKQGITAGKWWFLLWYYNGSETDAGNVIFTNGGLRAGSAGTGGGASYAGMENLTNELVVGNLGASFGLDASIGEAALWRPSIGATNMVPDLWRKTCGTYGYLGTAK